MKKFFVQLCLSVIVCGSALEARGDVDETVTRALDFLVSEQKRQGYWEAEQGAYRVAMTALVGTAMLAEGSTTTTGRYANSISQAVDYLLAIRRQNGLIGYREDSHYTYGHGFSMLFLSQVYGEEEDIARRQEIREALTLAVQFCADCSDPIDDLLVLIPCAVRHVKPGYVHPRPDELFQHV